MTFLFVILNSFEYQANYYIIPRNIGGWDSIDIDDSKLKANDCKAAYANKQLF